MTARQLAHAILCRQRPEGPFASRLLEEELRRTTLSDRDRRLCQRLVLGVVCRQRTLRWLLSGFSNQPYHRLEIPVQWALQLGAHQLLFLDRIPARAAVNETVSLVKKRARGFVNAILRNLERSVAERGTGSPPQDVAPEKLLEVHDGQWVRFEKPLLPGEDTPLEIQLGVRHSHPDKLVRRWLEGLGRKKAERILRLDNRQAPLHLRVNPLRKTRQEVLAALVGAGFEAAGCRLEGAITLPSDTVVGDLPGLAEGWYTPQDLTAQRIVREVGAQPHERILDLFAAPGGKATGLAEQMEDRGTVIARDVSTQRLKLVSAAVERLGLRSVRCQRGDALETVELGLFDRVLADVPCSNTGVLRRRLEARWRFTHLDLKQLAAEQRAFLEAAAACVRPGGVLVYSTCSIEPEENLGVVQGFVNDHLDDFELDEMRPFLPSEDGGDGGFCARLVRRSGRS